MSEPKLTVPGSALRKEREGYGVQIKELAAKLQHSRNTITAWEQHPAVDVRRQRLYLAALRSITREDSAA